MPINPIVNDTFTMGFIFCTGRTRTEGESLGSEPTAAGGGERKASEWPRSQRATEHRRGQTDAGTATVQANAARLRDFLSFSARIKPRES